VKVQRVTGGAGMKMMGSKVVLNSIPEREKKHASAMLENRWL